MTDTTKIHPKRPMESYVIPFAVTAIALWLMWMQIAWLKRSADDFHERRETQTRVEYVRSYQRGCPAIAERLSEYIADGRVTDEEDEVIDTIMAQQRALPGGLTRCRRDASR